jgi:hypothetical protein
MESDEIKTNVSLPVPAVGALTVAGVFVFGLECVFVTPGAKTHLVTFNASGLGLVLDFAEAELVGAFFDDPRKFVGKCDYSLEEVETEAGEAELTLTRKGIPIGTFTGPAEGVGAFIGKNKKGHLHAATHTNDENNYVLFNGDASIKSIDFQLESECISKGQSYHGVHADWPDSKGNELRINVKCGRHGSDLPAEYFLGAAQDIDHVIGLAGERFPKSLNFAIGGVLTIDNESFEVCLGQGHTQHHNPWDFASLALSRTPGSFTRGDIGGYTIECVNNPDDSHRYHRFSVKRRA